MAVMLTGAPASDAAYGMTTVPSSTAPASMKALLNENAARVRALRESGASLDFTAVEGPGEHLWTTWDANLAPALAWLLSIS